MLKLYNSLTRTKEEFTPLDAKNVRLYVCGPTVYDNAHIGNARPAIVFDVLFRLLRHLAAKGEWDGGKGETEVKYVRNITDVDDKIIDRARRDYPDLDLNAAIKQVTTSTTEQYQADVKALGCQDPTEEPKATDHIEAMQDIIATLVAKDFAYEAKGSLMSRLIEVIKKKQIIATLLEMLKKGFAYRAKRHVLFRVDRMADYGKLSGRSTDAMLAEARIEAAAFKENPMDFVLWKPSDADQPGWGSPWGHGRPGWHLECSAMAKRYLGEVFDIHGGGIDLKFPHHENEIAQSRCAFGADKMANIWMHNGFLQVEGEKMSKSLGNFITIRELLEEWPGEVLRLAMLMTHYRQPIDWTEKRLREARKTLDDWYRAVDTVKPTIVDPEFLDALKNDMNTPAAITRLHRIYDQTRGGASGPAQLDVKRTLLASANLLGLLQEKLVVWFSGDPDAISKADVENLITARNSARRAKNFADADRIRDQLDAMGVTLKDTAEGTTWEVKR